MRCYICDCPLEDPTFDGQGLAEPCDDCQSVIQESLEDFEDIDYRQEIEGDASSGQDVPEEDAETGLRAERRSIVPTR